MPENPASARISAWRKPILLVLVLVALFVAARTLGLDKLLGQLQPWIQSLGPWAPLAFIGLYIVATVLAIPGSAITIAASLLFGSLWGVVYVSIGSTLGAALCFLIARYVARASIAKGFENNAAFQRLDALTAEQGAMIVAITRLVPLFPFNLLNYGFGLTQVPFMTYVLWSWLCMLPGTILYIVGADALSQALTQGQIPWHLVAIAGAMFAALAWITRRAKASLPGEAGQ